MQVLIVFNIQGVPDIFYLFCNIHWKREQFKITFCEIIISEVGNELQ